MQTMTDTERTVSLADIVGRDLQTWRDLKEVEVQARMDEMTLYFLAEKIKAGEHIHFNREHAGAITRAAGINHNLRKFFTDSTESGCCKRCEGRGSLLVPSGLEPCGDCNGDGFNQGGAA